MNQELMIFGFVLAIFAYLVGIKKATWLLAGYNQKRVADQEKLATSVGLTYALSALWLLIWGLVGVANSKLVGSIAVGLILLQLVYVQMKMVG